jgi:hypothetical protein
VEAVLNYLSQTQVLRLYMDTLRKGIQNFTCTGVLLANTHQELDGLAVRLSSKIKDWENLLLLWQGHWQIKEWVKSDGDLGTHRAHQL